MKKKHYTEDIIQIIKASKYAVSHSQLQEHMKIECNRVTIYRILDKLVKQGLIHKIMTVDGITKFAACNSCSKEKHVHNHIHFSCNTCNQVTCLDEIKPNIVLPKNYVVSQINYTISGVCPRCN